jgi:hypothetical protein
MCRYLFMGDACLMLLLVVVWVKVVDGTGGSVEQGLRSS